MPRRHLMPVLAGLLVLMSGCATPQPPPAAKPGPPLKPVATVLQIMKAIVIPSSDAVFHISMEAPKNDEEWAALQYRALALAEAGNLLMMEGRAKDQDAWMKAAQALVEAGTTAAKAAEAKNADAVMTAGDEVYDTCEGCHKVYLEGARMGKEEAK